MQQNESVIGDAGVFGEAMPPQRKDLGLYRPLTVLTWRLQFRESGLDPFAFHLGNVLLHGLAVALVFALARRLRCGRATATLAAALFACHPVHVEAVAWVVGRAEILCAVFALLALLAWLPPDGGTQRHARLRSVAAALLYGLAAISKESALALPLGFFLLDRLRRIPFAESVRRLAPSAVVAVAIVLIRIRVLGRFAPDVTPDPYLSAIGFGERLLLAVTVLGRALMAWCFPRGLSVFYDGPTFLRTLPVALAFLAIGAAALAIAWRKGRAAALAGFALFGACVLPFLHLVPIAAIYADRFLYLPSIGLAIATASLLAEGRKPGTGLLAGALAAIVLAGLTIARNPAFHDPIALWLDAADAQPDAAFPHFQLGGFYKKAGILEYQSEARKGALFHWNESLRKDPRHWLAPETHVQIGEYHAAVRNDAVEAARHYRAALALQPDYVEALLDLAALHRNALPDEGQAVSKAEAAELLRHAQAVATSDEQRALIRRLLDEPH